ncbi:MAG TPA: proton-conducting transporter membrane subunit [Candidatus Dormibacteraeota bacterium]|nr:proton-conducting transporter membrane subunit [Candidatus Dormibacteraeota bacterium]
MRTFGNLLVLSPELWLVAGAIVVFALARFTSGGTATWVAVVTLALAFLALATQFKQTLTVLGGAFALDGFAIVADVVILASAALALLTTKADVLPGEREAPTLPGFFLLATLGAMLAVSAAEMVALFLALELLAVNLYILTGLTRRGPGSAATSVGYLLLGTVGTGFLVYGLALVFGLTGQTELRAAGASMSELKPTQAAVLLALSLLLGGFAVRMGLVPVRWWTRTFEIGVPLRVVLFVESVGVVTGLAVFGRLLAATFAGTRVPYAAVLAGVAAIAMTAGTLMALMQTSIRRLLVYSMIAQAGFGLAAFTDLNGAGLSALLVFLVALALTSVAAFATVIAYSRSVHSDAISDLAGMSRATPGLALALALTLLSLAGLPPLAGFLGKLLILQAAVDGGYTWLAVIAAANIVIAALGSLRVIRTVFIDPPIFEVIPARLDRGIQAAIGLACAGLVFIGLFLEPLYRAASYGRNALLH